MTFDEYNRNRISKFGRKPGSIYRHSVRDVYDSLRASGDVDVKFSVFRKILELAGKKVWEALYQGKVIAIPYLFNMEIVPSNFKWTHRVNWSRTHKLWSEDEEAFRDKLLVRHEPSRFYVRVKHSTVSRNRKHWYYPLMLDIRLSRRRLRDIETKYELAL